MTTETTTENPAATEATEQDRQSSAQQLLNKAQQIDQQNAPIAEPAKGVYHHVAGGEAHIEDGGEVITVEDTQRDLEGFLKLATGLIAPMFPSIGQIYTPETMRALAEAFAPVMIKRGWKVGNLAGRYAEEVGFAMVAVPVAMATYHGIRHDLHQMKAAKQAAIENEKGKAGGAANE